jgi:hypothetical protein
MPEEALPTLGDRGHGGWAEACLVIPPMECRPQTKWAPRVHASHSPALPRRPCRLPLALCLVGRVVRVVVAVVGGWSPRVRALRRTCQPSRPPLALCLSRRRHRHHRRRRCRSPHCRGGATSSSLASSIINAKAASSTPVRQAAFVARGHTSALWCLPHPRAFGAEAAASLLVAAALTASGRCMALMLASTVHWAAIVPWRRRWQRPR